MRCRGRMGRDQENPKSNAKKDAREKSKQV
jgi:hypothetical protein